MTIEVCLERDARGVGVMPHAVHTGANEPVIHDPASFVRDGRIRFSVKPQVVYTIADDPRVQVAGIAPSDFRTNC